MQGYFAWPGPSAFSEEHMSEKIFRWVLRFYPRRFRCEYGDAMWQLFHDRLRAEAGIPGRARLWLDLLLDTVVAVPREHRRPPQLAVSGSGGYRLSEQAVAEMVRRSHIRQFPAVILSVAGGLLIALVGDAPRWPSFGVYGLLLLFFMTSLRGIGRFKDGWRTYELVLQEGRIQEKHAARSLTLDKAEITRLVETRGLGIAIQTGDPRKSIWVPSVVDGYEELRLRLTDWAPLEQRSDPRQRFTKHSGFQWIVAIYPAAMMVRSPYFVVALAAILGMYLVNVMRVVRLQRTLLDGAAVRTASVPGSDPAATKSFSNPAAWVIPVVLMALLIGKVVLALR